MNAPEQVYSTLRDLIVRGQLAPGSRVVEHEVSAKLHVSRTPVRGAIQRLQREGFVLASETAGAIRPVVTPLTREDAAELYTLVGVLEGIAAREAASLPRDERLVLADELKVLDAEFRRAAERKKPHGRGHPQQPFDIDAEFHRRIVNAVAGPRLKSMHAVAHPQAERYDRLYPSAVLDALEHVEEDHRAVFRAIREGDPHDAQRAAVAHWRNALERLGWAIETSGERGVW